MTIEESFWGEAMPISSATLSSEAPSTSTKRNSGGSQTLYRKWRSQTFDQLVGQDAVTRTLKNAITSGRVGHAYLFCGPRGTGKTSTGRLLAKAVNCLDEDPQQRPCDKCEACRSIAEARALDLIEIDAASNRGIDEVRELRDKINFQPAFLRKKVYIIDEAHMMTEAAFNALLKNVGRTTLPCLVYSGNYRPTGYSRHGSITLPAVRLPAHQPGTDCGPAGFCV